MKTEWYSVFILMIIAVSASGQHQWRVLPDKTQSEPVESLLALDNANRLKCIASSQYSNWTHERFERYYQDTRVLGEQVIVHRHQGRNHSINGSPMTEIVLPGLQPLEYKHIRESALNHFIHTEANGRERQKKLSMPSVKIVSKELVISDQTYPLYSGNYTKAWLISLSHGLLDRRKILVDAYSGNILVDINLVTPCQHLPEGGIASNPTLYHGIQNINGQFIGQNEYALTNTVHQTAINILRSDSSHFIDDDGFYLKSDTSFIMGALDAIWATEKTLEFLKDNFNQIGVSNQPNDTLNSYIFPLDIEYNNAFWDGQSVFYGTGDSDQNGPFTSIDICAHEILHGVTQNTSGLEYTHESGAINEGFSDIFGKAIEYTYSKTNFTWELGDRIGKDSFAIPGQRGFRNMADPHRYGHPKYYKGQFWRYTRFDNGGVHFNSGVLNHWFYLLCKGGSGVNEGSQAYAVDSIDIDDAIQICYDALTNYLTPTSQYLDVRNATLWSAERLFGKCSKHYRSVAQAWHAVGLYSPPRENDMALTALEGATTNCLHQPYFPEVEILNAGCQTTFSQGDTLLLSFSYDNRMTAFDTTTLPKDLDPGETWNYTFKSSINDSIAGRHPIRITIESPNDTFDSNNIIEQVVEYKEDLDFDIEVIPVFDNRSICERGDSTGLFIAGIYNGCTPILSSDSIRMLLDLNGKKIDTFIHPNRSIYPDGYVLFGTFQFTGLKHGNNRVRVQFNHANDRIIENNWQIVDLFVIDEINSEYHEDFTSPESVDSSLINISLGKNAYHSIQEEEGETCFAMTGGSLVNPDGSYNIDTANINFALLLISEHEFHSNISICYDSRKFIDPILEFEIKRSLGAFGHEAAGFPESHAAATSVNFDGFVEYLVDLPFDEFKTYRYHLSDEDTIQQVILRNFVLQGGIDPTSGEIPPQADRIFYNYIRIFDRSVSSHNLNEASEYHLAPNPSNGVTFLRRSKKGNVKPGKLTVYSSTGQLVDRIKWDGSQAEVTLDSSLPPGIYSVILEEKSAQKTVLKWIKKK